MDIRVLRYYLAICREGTMSRAAQVLHVTQPTLSRQIADLERELGCELLVRGSRSVTPTEKGLYLRRRAEEIVALADQTTSELSRGDEVLEGDVYIGAGESEGMQHIAATIRSFRSRYPHVRFHLRSGNSIDVMEWLERGLVDCAVLIAFPGINRFEHVRLSARDTWGVLMPARHPLTQKEAIEPADLEGVPLILSEQALETGELSQWFGALKDCISTAATYNLVFNAAQLVRENVGCALVLEKLVATGEGTGLEFRPMHPPVLSPIDVAWRRAQTLSAAAKLFLEAIRTPLIRS
ncbi:MAG TPA: LysR family transcriptional regulator [Candidatus Aphodovivens excrementavium]|nr:LysR family transcriptional regulator [Candidatus Aphodovivens excrementavium]